MRIVQPVFPVSLEAGPKRREKHCSVMGFAFNLMDGGDPMVGDGLLTKLKQLFNDHFSSLTCWSRQAHVSKPL